MLPPLNADRSSVLEPVMTYRLSLTCSMTVASSAACDGSCSELTTADSPPTRITVPSTNTRFMTSLRVFRTNV